MTLVSPQEKHEEEEEEEDPQWHTLLKVSSPSSRRSRKDRECRCETRLTGASVAIFTPRKRSPTLPRCFFLFLPPLRRVRYPRSVDVMVAAVRCHALSLFSYSASFFPLWFHFTTFRSHTHTIRFVVSRSLNKVTGWGWLGDTGHPHNVSHTRVPEAGAALVHTGSRPPGQHLDVISSLT